MVHARSRHPNAPLTPTGRRRMVDCVLDQGWTIEAAADRFQVDAKWRSSSSPGLGARRGPDGAGSHLPERLRWRPKAVRWRSACHMGAGARMEDRDNSTFLAHAVPDQRPR